MAGLHSYKISAREWIEKQMQLVLKQLPVVM
jgi:hypothetical protein